MDKTRHCIDCKNVLRHISPLAKRCRSCRRKYQDRVSYDIKKRKRKIISKEKTLNKVKKIGLKDEIAENAKEKLIEEFDDTEKLIEEFDETQKLGFDYSIIGYSAVGPKHFNLKKKNLKETINGEIKKQIKDELKIKKIR